MKSPNSLSDDDLRGYLDEHLQYEHDMLVWSAGILARLFPHQVESAVPWALVNALLNTFALHARNLIDFLYSRSDGKDYPTDIVIEDLVGEAILTKYLPTISPLLSEARVKANKQATHLTMERIEFEQVDKKGWKFFAIAEEIKKALAAIAPHIPQSRINDKLREKLSQGSLSVPLIDVAPITASNGAKVGISLSLAKKPSQPGR